MKVKLLNDGGYGHNDGVEFPVVVSCLISDHQGIDVLVSELQRVGIAPESECFDYSLYFTPDEFELVEHE